MNCKSEKDGWHEVSLRGVAAVEGKHGLPGRRRRLTVASALIERRLYLGWGRPLAARGSTEQSPTRIDCRYSSRTPVLTFSRAPRPASIEAFLFVFVEFNLAADQGRMPYAHQRILDPFARLL